MVMGRSGVCTLHTRAAGWWPREENCPYHATQALLTQALQLVLA